MNRIRISAVILFAAVAALVVVNFGLTASKGKAEASTRARASAAGASPAAANFVLVAHGGAGSYSGLAPGQLEGRRNAMIEAVRKGYGILAGGGSSLDAVEATIRVMEDSGLFDAGRGAYYTREGVPELDAAIMDGRTLAAGSVGSVKHIANPIHLARLVMEKTAHVMLVSGGAEDFAKLQGIELVSPYYFYNEREWERYKKAKSEEERKKISALLRDEEHGTVGVVALDQAGNLAAGTSTGGTTLKMPGRVGDSPIIGAGTYANNESCAVSGTGVGEYFMRNVVAADICERVRYLHVTVEQAADDVVMKELAEQHGEAGVIALDRHGNAATPFNTAGMMTGTVRADGKIEMKGWSKNAEPMVVAAEK
jgi:L-asparaginase / beta-aspartyl-peptidase